MRNKNEKRATPKLSDSYSLGGDIARRKQREAAEAAKIANEAAAVADALRNLESGGMITVDLSDRDKVSAYLKAANTNKDRFFYKRGKSRYVFGSVQTQAA